MPLLHVLSYAGAAGAFLFITLSLASGLLWLSELIEEHSRTAKVIGQRSIYAVMILHVLLCFSESLPVKHTIFSIFCHIVYLQNFTPGWPFISLTSLSFILSCILVITDHFLWFFYFAHITQDARQRAHRPYGAPSNAARVPGFAEIATFFGLCVWLAPLFLFLSLSANDNALPLNAGQSSMPTTPTSPVKPIMIRPHNSLFKSLYDSLPRIRPRPRRRDTSEGIIAPRSPNVIRPSPSPSPVMTPTGGLQRVPSTTGLSRPVSPIRRGSSDGLMHSQVSGMLSAAVTDHNLSDRAEPFKLGTPPRRMTGSSSSHPPTERRLEMRRAVSAYASSVSKAGATSDA